MKKFLLFCAVIASLGVPAAGRPGDDRDERRHGHGHGHDDDDRDDDRGPGYRAAYYFRPEDRQLIAEHCRPRDLPPGLARKLARTGRLPPGWEKRFQPLPVVVEQQLPPVCGGCRRGIVDNYAVVFNPRTNIIIDVMFFGR